jgi:hypothetical protein
MDNKVHSIIKAICSKVLDVIQAFYSSQISETIDKEVARDPLLNMPETFNQQSSLTL